MGFFYACGELPLGRRPLYPDDPVDPVYMYFLIESISLSIKISIFVFSMGPHLTLHLLKNKDSTHIQIHQELNHAC